MPDLHNGYIIDTAEKIRRRLLAKNSLEPRKLESSLATDVVCFGSDGGGGRFAFVADSDDRIWYLPTGGVVDGVFQDRDTPIIRLARNVPEFGERLVADIEAFIEGRLGWKYIGA